MNTTARYTIVLSSTLLTLLTGCADPVQPDQPVPTASPAQNAISAGTLPETTHVGAVYEEASPIYESDGSDAYHGGTLRSRFILGEEGGFSLEFFSPNFGMFEYPGRYSRDGTALELDFDGWSRAGPWLATGTLEGDSLTVTYNVVMMLSDFVDGTYVLAASVP